MEKRKPSWTLGELAAIFGGELEGDPSVVISRPAPAGDSDPTGLTFAESEKFFAKADSVAVGAILAGPGQMRGTANVIRVDQPRRAFGQFLAMCAQPMPLNAGIHPSAAISPDAWIDPTAQVGPFAVIEAGTRVEANARIFAHAYIGEDCVIGEGVVVYPHAVLYRDITVGARSILHAHVAIGADGFGFRWDGTKQIKVPQVGRVEIGSDVEIGALTAVDRATAGATKIGNGSKVDNLVMVAHNVAIGEHTVVAAQVGLAGSSSVGSRVTVAGQVALSDHVHVGDDIILGGRTAVTGDIPNPGVYLGYPARPYQQATRVLAATIKLPEFIKRLRDVERKLEEKS